MTDQHQPGVKLDHDKIDLSLLQEIPLALEEVARVMDYGQTKYTRGGFATVANAVIRYSAAMLRHFFKEPFGIIDEDDPFYETEKGARFKGLIRHDAQVAVNALFRLECRLRAEKQEREHVSFGDLLKEKYGEFERSDKVDT